MYWVVMLWVGLLLAGIAVPFIRRRIPPNALAGFRTGRTLADPRVWYEANRIMGWDLLWCGALILASSAATFLLRHAVPFDRLVLANTFVLMAGVAWMVGHGLWRLSKL
jgi:uncharacterized membrane protein